MSDHKDTNLCHVWLTRPLESAELMFLEGVEANDRPSDDCCVICQEPYDTPNEDGTTREYALYFPCGHAVGNACFQIWLDGSLPKPGCIFCNKTMIPARYLQEQVEEIWTMANEMSPERIHDELNNKTTRGRLTRAVEPLWRYVGEAPSLDGYKHHNEKLVPSFVWLLIATSDFLAALEKYAEISTRTNHHEINLKALKRRKCEFQRNYYSFQKVVEEMAMARMAKEAARGEQAMDNVVEEGTVRVTEQF